MQYYVPELASEKKADFDKVLYKKIDDLHFDPFTPE